MMKRNGTTMRAANTGARNSRLRGALTAKVGTIGRGKAGGGVAGVGAAGFAVLKFCAIAIGVAGLVGCVVGPDYQKPMVELPAGLGDDGIKATQAVDIARWWTTFNDPQLTQLIEQSVKGSLDLKLATARLNQARAQRTIDGAGLWPGVNVGGKYSRSRSSENAFAGGQGQGGQSSGQAGAGAFNLPGSETDLFQAGFDASWELDVFGGVRRRIEAADAQIQFSVEDRRDVLVTLMSEVARNYLELRGFQQQIVIAKENVKIQQEAVDVSQSKARLAGGSELDVARAKAVVNTTQANIPMLEAQRDQAAYRLAVLLGKPPRSLLNELARVDKPIAKGPPVVPAGLPSDLLKRRPDIRKAEANLMASNARIGVATADLFPKFSLTGSLGLQSEKFGSFGDWGSRYWNIGPSISWPIFDAGKIRANIELAKSQDEQAGIEYQRVVLNALSEVESALIGYAKEQVRRLSLQSAVDNNRRSVELAKALYQGGARDFLNVIDAERALAQSEDSLVQSDRTISTNLVALYKALGGGWSESDLKN